MVASPAAADAVARAKALPSLRVGLHVVVVEAAPALPPEQIPDLVGANGLLRNDRERFSVELMLRPNLRRQLYAEIEAQFAAYRATGLPLDHVNFHQHLHLHPVIASYALDIGARNGAKAIRVPIELPGVLRRIEPTARPSWFLVNWCKILRAQARAAGITVPDACFGLTWSGAMTAPRIKGLLDNLPPGLVEIYAHPAVANSYPLSAPGYRYRDELAALIDPGCIEAARRSGYRLGGFSDA